MNPNRWDIVRCDGKVEHEVGIKFVLIDKRTGLVVGTDDADRKPLRDLAEAKEADEAWQRKQGRIG